MIDRSTFALRTQRVLSSANDESARFRHEYIGTEHVLLGLLRETEGVGVAVLHNLGADFDAMRRHVETTVKLGPPANVSLSDRPFTTRVKRVLDLAVTESRQLGHSWVGTEHLLLGLVVEGKGIGAQVLHFGWGNGRRSPCRGRSLARPPARLAGASAASVNR